MADATLYNQDLFTCPICLDLLKDPVTILCGHSYCMGCIKGCWDQEDQKGVYSCPQCRQTFSPRPVLYKNNIFAELVEQTRKTRIHTPSLAHGFAGPGDVECDVCTGRKLKAVKSCLECLVSYCETHYEVHNNIHPGRKHSVIEATGQLQERICSQHKKIFEIFCRTDQSCICYPCMMDEHKGHDTVTAAAERTDKQKQCRETQRRFQQRIQEREKELQELRKAVLTLKSSAQTAVEDSEKIFTEMIRSIERRCSEVKELIRDQEKAEVSRAEGLLKRLEQEIAELKRRDAELEQLSLTEDHIHFLKTFQSVSETPESKDLSCISVNQGLSFEAVKKSVSSLKRQLEYFCKEEVLKISASVTKVQAVLSPEPTTREDFLQCADPEPPVRRTNSNEKLPPNMSEVQAEPATREEFSQCAQCGYVGIVKGIVAEPHSRPYMVSVQEKERHICGGFLVHESFVMTAAHCITWGVDLTVVVGVHDITEPNSGTRIPVKLYHVHPEYDFRTLKNDIALLQLTKPAKKSRFVQWISLPQKDGDIKAESVCSVAGWGATKTNGSANNLLLQADVVIKKREQCQKLWGNFKISKNMLCASDKAGFGQGISGGPLVYKKRAVGVMSFSEKKNCDKPTQTNVYTKISGYLPWINSVSK